MTIYHLINPYQVNEDSEDFLVQNRTIESLMKAIEMTKDLLDIKIIFKVDSNEVAYFKNKYNFEYIYVSELKTDSSLLEKEFNVKRNLPLLNDLVNLDVPDLSELNMEDDDLVVFTNMDICVQPFFYSEISKIYNAGCDVFVINRRTIDKELLEKELSHSYFATGDKHIGHDCFVLPIRKLKKFNIKEHILGIGFVFRPFLFNCILHANNFHEFDDAYLTFHYGDDMDWKNEKYSDYIDHNRDLLIDVYREGKDMMRTQSEKKQALFDKFFSFDFLKE